MRCDTQLYYVSCVVTTMGVGVGSREYDLCNDRVGSWLIVFVGPGVCAQLYGKAISDEVIFGELSGLCDLISAL